MQRSQGKVRALGEVALRVNNLDPMVDFYLNVIQLPLMRRNNRFAFFRLAEGFAGHTQILALFDRSADPQHVPPVAKTTTVDHIAFTIALDDFESEKRRLLDLGYELEFAEHGWVQWRSLYLNDPEGNTVEFVCVDESIERVKLVDD